MAPKRAYEDDEASSKPKKARSKFQVGPDNLPDGTYRRKVIKIKKDLIEKAKLKKSYAKLKAREPTESHPIPTEEVITEPNPTTTTQELHPERQAMLDAPAREPSPPTLAPRARGRKPGYYDKEQEYAAQQKAEATARREEFERRDRERKGKVEERERFRRTMAKARMGGKNGQRKLGRESTVLLEKVRRIVGS